MWNELIGAILQLMVFALVPLIIYLIEEKQFSGFLIALGVTSASSRTMWIGVAGSLVLFLPILFFASRDGGFQPLFIQSETVIAKLQILRPGFTAFVILMIAACIKTALAEELFFRGFIAKRLINLLGFHVGNLLQALIFGWVQLILFAAISRETVYLAIIFFVYAFMGWLAVLLNENYSDGSILPGWMIHAVGNIVLYGVLGFGLT